MLAEATLVQRLGDLVGPEHVTAGEAASAFAIDGRVPGVVVYPASVQEVSAIMALASAEGKKVIPWGGGTKMAYGSIPEQVHLILALSRLNRLVDYEPGDMTATFQAGMPLREAQVLLGRNGQHIALDPPHAELATIGGILATNSSGPRRLGYGTSRDLVLAMRLVHADGKLTKCGAKVVKNVTGYDMNKLYIGSLGTLGVIAEATFRLYPKPSFEQTYLASFPSVDAAQRVVARLLDSPTVTSAVELLNARVIRHAADGAGLSWPDDPYALAVATGSIRREALSAQLGTVRRLCAEGGASDGNLLEGQVHELLWKAIRDFKFTHGFRVILKTSVLPMQVAACVKLAEEVTAKEGLELGVVSEAGSGIIRYYLTAQVATPERSMQKVIEAVRCLRAFAREAQGSLVILEAPPEVKKQVDVWGPVGKTLPLMRALKEQFDPGKVLNPGRFVGGI